MNLQHQYAMPSSVVKNFYYENQTKSLLVIFVSGIVYRYKDVPKEIYNQMKQSFSKGTFLNTFIKGKYIFERVDE